LAELFKNKKVAIFLTQCSMDCSALNNRYTKVAEINSYVSGWISRCTKISKSTQLYSLVYMTLASRLHFIVTLN